MGEIRTFAERDIPQVANLHRTVFKTAERAEAVGVDGYHAYFRRVFLDNPTCDPALPSLVYEDDTRRVVGFLGVVPRRVVANGHTFQAAISSQFVVDPATRVGLVAVRLAKAFLDGPQDLSITDEANDVARKIWEGLGGTTSLLRSLHWTRPLRPARLALSLLRGRAALAPLAMAAGSVAPLIDGLATRMRHSQFRQPMPPSCESEELTEYTVVAHMSEFPFVGSLHVEYDERTLCWLLERARRRAADETLRRCVVRKGRTIVGWYVYHVDSARTAHVVHLAAAAAATSDVLDHLLFQASEDGAIAVAGRLEPRDLQMLADKYCVFHRRGPWVLVKANRSELLRSFESADAVFSRLDGEWCLGF